MEDTSIQITWGSLPEGPIAAEVTESGTRTPMGAVTKDHGGGAGALIIGGLRPDTPFTVTLQAVDTDPFELEGRTLPPPPGAEVARFATISDMHLGSDHFGFFRQMVDRSGHDEPFAFRSASGAIEEALAWGASSIVIKGDAAHHGRAHHFTEVGRLVDAFPHVPITLLPGNHDVDRRPDPLPRFVGSRQIPYIQTVDHLDLPHLRLVFGNTTVETKGAGTLADTRDQLISSASEADGAAMVIIHQQLQEHNQVRYWPPGIRGDEARSFLDALASGNANTLVTSGHTHRNRQRRHGSVVITEVAATHHWPAVWAGYVVHEGGIRQVVHRISTNDTIDWHEYSKNAVLGVWGRYAPGRLHARCFSHTWS